VFANEIRHFFFHVKYGYWRFFALLTQLSFMILTITQGIGVAHAWKERI
jgi:hypothetical protein